ncbi:hypothetical protein FJO69_02170 [[Mycoplasma] falconis]|uniref:DUF4064 domain-containing protein n=1 Tax=[Mycoplasma] falconis TaxID=92403 RepID=A0A501XA00_9BACT|nr:hypothetical protein [[Mycoplasma] falconis]TPE57197.1 hypothetical protein FJO69_02170 [[Mycoplasma] falconis]
MKKRIFVVSIIEIIIGALYLLAFGLLIASVVAYLNSMQQLEDGKRVASDAASTFLVAATIYFAIMLLLALIIGIWAAAFDWKVKYKTGLILSSAGAFTLKSLLILGAIFQLVHIRKNNFID